MAVALSRLLSWLPGDRRQQGIGAALLAFLFLERLLLVLTQPDLVQDLDAAELKLMDLALHGLPGDDPLKDRLFRWLAGPENVHHGGFPTVSILFLCLSKVLGTSLWVLRLVPIGATVAAAACLAVWLGRRAGPSAALLALVVLAGAPPLFLKWTCTARGGHIEAILFAPAMLLLVDAGTTSERRLPWFGAGIVGGFAVYFSYLCAPLVALISLGALAERRAAAGVLPRAAILVAGGVIGFLPWILGLLLLDLPYLDATIHQSGMTAEAAQVHGRGLSGTLSGALTSLPQNLWPWGAVSADAGAYLSEAADLLDYRPTALTWVLRGLVISGCVLGGAAAVARRSPLLGAVVLLPAVHYLFVIRLANPGQWPEIPHRYLVLVFPAVAASIGIGLHWLGTGGGALRRRIAGTAAGVIVLVGAYGAVLHLGWLGAPDIRALKGWDAAGYRAANIGSVRQHEGPAMGRLLDQHRSPAGEMDGYRGIEQIYPATADYYLLFRSSGLDSRPYPDELFSRPDPSVTPDGGAVRMVHGAYDATVLRAAGDEERLRGWVCSWRPSAQFDAAVAEVLAREAPGLDCP